MTRWGRSARRSAVTGALAAAVALAAGLAAGSALTISKDANEHASGTHLTVQGVGSWWTPTGYAVTVLGASPPPVASNSSSSPTLLPSSGASHLLLLPAVGGANVVFWEFSLTTAAPPVTELELTFILSQGVLPNVTAKVYVETPPVAVTSSVDVKLYLPTGTATLTSLTLQAALEVAQQCTFLGVCP